MNKSSFTEHRHPCRGIMKTPNSKSSTIASGIRITNLPSSFVSFSFFFFLNYCSSFLFFLISFVCCCGWLVIYLFIYLVFFFRFLKKEIKETNKQTQTKPTPTTPTTLIRRTTRSSSRRRRRRRRRKAQGRWSLNAGSCDIDNDVGDADDATQWPCNEHRWPASTEGFSGQRVSIRCTYSINFFSSSSSSSSSSASPSPLLLFPTISLFPSFYFWLFLLLLSFSGFIDWFPVRWTDFPAACTRPPANSRVKSF